LGAANPSRSPSGSRREADAAARYDRPVVSELSTRRAADWGSLDTLFSGDRWASPHTRNIGRRRLWPRVARRHAKALRRLVRLSIRPSGRSAERVSGIYEAGYAPTNDQFVRSRAKRRDAFLLEGKPVWGNGWYSIEFRSRLIERVVDLSGARTVLEVGSGRGVNLALLALSRPSLDLTGIELTETGVARSRELAARPPTELLELVGASTPTAEQRAALGRLRFEQADATALPFDDESFDLVFTYLVLEQIPNSYPQVVREAARVSRRWCAFVEPFADANGPFGRAQLHALDYFRARTSEFREYGLQPVHFTTRLPQKVHFRTGLLVAERVPA
jgi:SAM-dependent methyltransferase